MILADDAPEDETLWAMVQPTFAIIRQALQGAGETRFAYISAGTRADYAARNAVNADGDD
ncbi:MAG TPA: hypothetical protein VLI90_07795 [Tepidisphaeraceae bacterium]|nr:hypothetical protein [Tepidisphaeraceae bacterium]